MKIEPIKHANTPKYLAALAIAASAAGILTGCRTAGEIAVTEGVAPMPEQSQAEELELAGDEAIVTEPDLTALRTEGDVIVTDDTASETVQSDPEEVGLEGDIVLTETDCTDIACEEDAP